MNKKSLLSPDVHRECIDRIEKLTPATRPAWGTMNAAQMMAHCAEVQEVLNGKPLENTPLMARLFKGKIRKMVVNEKPYPKNSRTHPQYVVTDERSFEVEKQRLLKAIEHTATMPEAERRRLSHPLFGPMTDEELGWSAYKHLDHHLSQFGV